MVARDGTGLIQRLPQAPFDGWWHLILGDGQSNSTASAAAELEATTAIPGAYCFGRDGRGSRDGATNTLAGGASGTWADRPDPPGCPLIDFTGLPASTAQEPLRAYSRNLMLYKQVEELQRRNLEKTGFLTNFLVATAGHTGYNLSQLAVGSNPYINSVRLVTQMNASLLALGVQQNKIVMDCVDFVQGEANFNTTGSGWKEAVYGRQQQHNIDLKAITGQTKDIPYMIVQNSNFCVSDGASAGKILYPVLDQLQAHIDYPGSIILCGPMYAAETIGATKTDDPYNFHAYGHQAVRWAHGLANISGDLLIDGKTPNPLRPKTITRTGNVIELDFYVPVPPLVLDTSYVTQLADGKHGLYFKQTGGSAITITSVALKPGSDTKLLVTLSAVPDGTSPILGAGKNAAFTAVPMGPRTGARTTLRDSANTLPQYCNRCVHFEIPIP